jgi:hypothetical protein
VREWGADLVIAFDLAIPEDDGALGPRRNIRLVRHHDHGLARRHEPVEDPHDVIRRPGIEIARRFVGQQDCWAIHQRARNGHPLPLPPGQFIRPVLQPSAQLHPL